MSRFLFSPSLGLPGKNKTFRLANLVSAGRRWHILFWDVRVAGRKGSVGPVHQN